MVNTGGQAVFFFIAVLCAPLSARWFAITDVPAPYNAVPALATASNRDILAASSDKLLRISPEGRVLWSRQMPLENIAALAATPDGGLFVGGSSATEGFVLKLDSRGNVLAMHRFAGTPAAIAVDASGAAYVTGSAREGFTSTPGAWKTMFRAQRCSERRGSPLVACSDAFVMKLKPDATLEWATLLGGTWIDYGRGIAMDEEGGVWVAGETLSDDFVTTPGAVQRTFGGIETLGPLQWGDAFVARLDGTGRRLLYASFFGGTNVDYATSIVPVGSGVVITGPTQSDDLTVTADAHQKTFSGDSNRMPHSDLDAFIAHFRISGELLYSSYYGTAENRGEYGSSAAVAEDATVGIALSGRAEPCLLRYAPATARLSEECYGLALYGSLAFTFANGTWIAAGRTLQGHEVPGVNPVPRMTVTPLGGIGDNTGPEVIGLWSEYVPTRRPLIAAGSIASIYGSGVGSAGVAGTSVRLGDRTLPVLYAGGDQINVMVPSNLPVGLHNLTVGIRFFGTVPVAVDVVPRWPGLYSGALNQDGSVNSEGNPAALGSVISLFGSGFGPEPLPTIEPYIAAPVETNAAGMEVLHAGRAPGTPEGIFQVNARIPMNARTGRVPVRLVLRLESGILATPLGHVWVE